MNTFEPKDGVQPRWRYAYDLVIAAEPGDDITYQQLAEALGLDHFDPTTRPVLLTAMWRAKKYLEREQQHTVCVVPKYGWRVISNTENLDEVEQRRLKAARAVSRTSRLINATHRAELSPIDRQRYDAEQRAAVLAGRLFNRKSPDFAQLERQSRARRELPQREE